MRLSSNLLACLIAAGSLSAQTATSVHATLGSTPVQNQLTRLSPVTDTVRGTPMLACSSNNGVNYMEFDVDDAWGSQGDRSELFFSIRYLDDTSGGTSQLRLLYKSRASSPPNFVSATEDLRLTLTNSGLWKTFTWHVTDAQVVNVTNVPDFRIDSPGGGLFWIQRASVTSGRSVGVDLGTQNVEQGIASQNLFDGKNLPATAGGLDCRVTDTANSGHYFYLDVDDSYALDANRREVYVTVEYFDCPAGSLHVQYDALGSSYKQTPHIQRGGTQQWLKYTWLLTDARFANNQNGGTDLRVAVPVGDTLFLNRVFVHDGSKVVADLAATSKEDGLSLYPAIGGDGETTSAAQGGLDCRTNVAGANYFYFRVDDAFALEGSRPEVYITIHYFDNNTDALRLQYDSSDAGAPIPEYKARSITRTGTGKWLAHTWHVDDAFFGNRQNGGSDFRIASDNGSPMFLDLAYVRDIQQPQRKSTIRPRFFVWDPVQGQAVEDLQPLFDLMTSPSSWANARSKIGNFMYHIEHWASSPAITDAQTEQWMAQIQGWGKLFGVQAPTVKVWGPGPMQGTMAGAQVMFDAWKGRFNRLIRLGGSISAVDMDEPFYTVRTHQFGPDSLAHSETAQWIRLVRETYPKMKIGSNEPFPLPFDHDDLTTGWIAPLNNRCAEIGVEGLDYFTMDCNWNKFLQGVSSWDKARYVREWCEAYAIPFNMIVWAPHPPTVMPNDQFYYTQVMQQGADMAASGLLPDLQILNNWLNFPIQTIPDNQQWSWTLAVNDYLMVYGL